MAIILFCVYSMFLLPIADSSLHFANNSEDRLLKFLFNDYNPEVRPVKNDKEAVNVRIGITLKQIIKVDFTHQILTSHIWIQMFWKNEFLTWSPAKFGGLKSINIEPIKVWIPDITLYNRASFNTEGGKDLYKRMLTKIILRHNGEMMWLAPAIISTECKVKVLYFPFDEQQCHLEIGSWTYNGAALDVNLHKPYVDLSQYSDSDEWVLNNTKAERRVQEYTCCPNDSWPTLFYTLFIKRKAMFFLGNLIVPCSLLSFVSLFSFVLPPNSGERVSAVMTILLALVVYMMIVTEKMPHSADMPLASKFFLFLIVELSVSLVMTCYIIRLHNNNSPLPKWVDTIVNHWLARILCMKKGKPQEGKDVIDKIVQATVFKNKGYLHEERDNNEPVLTKVIPSKETVNGSVHMDKQPAEGSVDILFTFYSEIKVLADKVRDERKKENYQNDWITVASVLDRLFLYILILSISITFLVIFLSVPKGAAVA